MKYSNTSILLILFAVAIPVTLLGNTIHVPADSATIQAGIDGAVSGDTVLLAAATYTGDGNRDLDFNGKNILLTSESGPEVTIIDCQGDSLDPHYALRLENGEDTTAVIEGITITNAFLTEWRSGAIWITDASATVRSCVVTNSHGTLDAYGKGIFNGFNMARTLLLYDSRVINNSGAGVWSEAWITIVSNCKISYNGGWGMEWSSWNVLDLSGTLFEGNTDDGLFIWTDGPDFHVHNCTFVGNGTGMHYAWNFPKDGPEDMEGSRSASLIENCLFAFNVNYGLYSPQFPYSMTITCNGSYGNGTADYELQIDGESDTSENYQFDPLFCDTASGDFRIAQESPAAPPNNACSVLIGASGVGCVCCKMGGNVDHLGDVNVADLTYLVDYLFRGGTPPAPCP